MKIILIIISTVMLTFSTYVTEASEILKILADSESHKVSRVNEWSKDRPKKDIVNELNQITKKLLLELEKSKRIAKKHQLELQKNKRRNQEIEKRYEALIRREQARYEREKEKVAKMKKEMEIREGYRMNCFCEEQLIPR